MRKRRLLRTSALDLACVAVIPVHITAYLLLFLYSSYLSVPVMLGILPVFFLMSIQTAGASHNHYHLPFFLNRPLNELTRMGFSMIGYPKTAYDLGHGVHHALDESWNNRSIIEIFGFKRPVLKQVLRVVQFIFDSLGAKYLLMFYLLKRWSPERLARTFVPEQEVFAVRVFKKLRHATHFDSMLLDFLAWLMFRVVLLCIDWRLFLFFFVPGMFFVETLRQADNYTQHWGATDPGDPRRDSVSCYGRLYNLLTFNLGYHQEHHFKPAVHWLKLPDVTAELPEDRRVVPFAHYINFPIFFPRLARDLRAMAEVDRSG